MMADTNIEWCTKVWNPTVGCSRISVGCERCYAERFAHRCLTERHRGLTVLGQHGPRWTGEVRLVPEALGAPLKWRKPQVVFVNSMSDLFHEKVPFEFIAAVFGVMAATPHHTYIVLTKRDARKWFDWLGDAAKSEPGKIIRCLGSTIHTVPLTMKLSLGGLHVERWPLPNVVLGVSVESGDYLRRIEWLLQTPAATRIVSLEPLLGPVDLSFINDGSWYDTEGAQLYNALSGTAYYRDGEHGLGGSPKLDGVIIGGESGHGARPCDVQWIRDVVRQCRDAGTPCFVKQLGANPVIANDSPLLEKWDYPIDLHYFNGQHFQGDDMPLWLKSRKGADPSEWPEELRVRDLPW